MRDPRALSDSEPGTRFLDLEHARLAGVMGRVIWVSGVFDCTAPDTGSMEILHLFAARVQREKWLVGLLEG